MKRGNIEFIAAMLIFGFNGVLASAIPWRSYEIVLARTCIGALTMLAILLFRRKKLAFMDDMASLKMIVFSGLSMGICWMFLFEAYRHIGVGLAQTLSSSGPAVAMVLSPLIFNEQLRKHKMVAFLIVVIGMLCISSNDLSGGSTFGVFCGICACLTYACFLIFNRFATAIEGPERTMWQLFIAAIVVFAFVLFKGTAIPTDLSLKTAVAVLLIGVVNTGLAMNLMFVSLPKLSLQTVAIYAFIEPMSALLFATLILGESITMLQLLGVFLILGGTAFAELYQAKT